MRAVEGLTGQMVVATAEQIIAVRGNVAAADSRLSADSQRAIVGARST